MEIKKTKLLFITQKIHEKDDDLAFVILWLNELVRQGFDVQVICLQKQEYHGTLPIFSLGKENGKGRITRTLKFLKLIMTLKYNRVFVHMNPEYFVVGGWYWWLRRTPMYLWYTHPSDTRYLRIAAWFCTRMFAATKQSLARYEGNPKKVVTGHGIDVDFWLNEKQAGENVQSEHRLVAIHRLSRVKRLELGIVALKYLPVEYTLDVYGRELEKEYFVELQELVKKEGLEHRVSFKGPLPMAELKHIYPQYRLLLNMAVETVDKTMLEAMLFGVYPVTTQTNSIAIGLPVFPTNDDPKVLAEFILKTEWKRYTTSNLQNIIKQKHSLPSLIRTLGEYIRKGN